MQDLIEHPERYLTTVEELLTAERMELAASLLRSATPRIEQTGFDSWNGGTDQWTIYLAVDTTDYALISTTKSDIEEQINQRLKVVLEPYTENWYSVKIIPRLADPGAVARPNTRIRRQTRLNIIDGLQIDQVAWHGHLNEIDFLTRIYNLQSLPSRDSRYQNAEADIYQHRINNLDWDDNWIYDDSRFELKNGADAVFLRFLCETVHPMVRPNKDEAIELITQYNDQIRQDGWELIEEEKIAGRPRFVARQIGLASEFITSRARSAAYALDAKWMQQEIQRLEMAIDTDPALAIGTAKDLVETCCKTILTQQKITFTKTSTLPELTKLLTAELCLVPEGIPEEAKGSKTIRLLLRNLTTITQYLSELRSLYGSGHGRDGKHRGLEPRHARLAVGAAVVFIDFMSETYHQRILPQTLSQPTTPIKSKK